MRCLCADATLLIGMCPSTSQLKPTLEAHGDLYSLCDCCSACLNWIIRVCHSMPVVPLSLKSSSNHHHHHQIIVKSSPSSSNHDDHRHHQIIKSSSSSSNHHHQQQQLIIIIVIIVIRRLDPSCRACVPRTHGRREASVYIFVLSRTLNCSMACCLRDAGC